VCSSDLLLALGDVELDLLPFVQAAVAVTGDRAEMHEHVRATALDRDEAITLVAVEPFHSALRHLDLLVVHAAPRHGRGRARHLVWPACHDARTDAMVRRRSPGRDAEVPRRDPLPLSSPSRPGSLPELFAAPSL